MGRMRIAFVYDTSYPESKGGVEKRVWELARRLARRGHEVHLLVPHAWKGPARIVRDDVVLRGVCRSRPLYTSKGRRAVRPALAHAIGVFRVLRSERFDLVDVQIPAHLAALSGWLATGRDPSRLLVTWHEAWNESWVEEMGLLGHIGRRVESLVARLPVRHAAVSKHTAEALAELGQEARAVITSGVEMVQPIGEALFAASDVSFVGRLVPTKNLGLLIDAVAILASRGLRAAVTVVGDGPHRPIWERQVDGLGLSDTVRFLGNLERGAEVMAVLGSSKVLAIPSIREGFGMVALEAAALGVPVVTVNHPRNAASHLVEHGVTGLSVMPEPVEFADALQQLLEDRELRQRMGREAKLRAGAATWDRAVDDTEAMYQSRVA